MKSLKLRKKMSEKSRNYLTQFTLCKFMKMLIMCQLWSLRKEGANIKTYININKMLDRSIHIRRLSENWHAGKRFQNLGPFFTDLRKILAIFDLNTCEMGQFLGRFGKCRVLGQPPSGGIYLRHRSLSKKIDLVSEHGSGSTSKNKLLFEE